MITQDFPLTKETWSLIFAGPTATNLRIENAGDAALYRVTDGVPLSSVVTGHKLDDSQGVNVTLEAGEFLYARSATGSTTLLVTGD